MKGILFNTQMVQATLRGWKTNTRRPVKPQPRADDECLGVCTSSIGSNDVGKIGFGSNNCVHSLAKPPHKKDDILYARETFNPDWCNHYIYKADGGSAKAAGYAEEPKWIPSIHMPKEAARLFLKVTDVRVERLVDITNSQAQSEGVVVTGYSNSGINRANPSHFWDFSVEKYITEWDRRYANKGYEYDSEPWTWVTELDVISKEDAYKLDGAA